SFYFFFFQAEDGIRDFHVTGVQTCALPIYPVLFSRVLDRKSRGEKVEFIDLTTRRTRTSGYSDRTLLFHPHTDIAIANCIMKQRSEERRVGKESSTRSATSE